MNKFSTTLILATITLPLLLEGLFITGDRLYVMCFICILTSCLLLFFKVKVLLFPKIICLILGLFLLLTLVSTFASQNIGISYPLFIYFCALTLLFGIAFNFKESIEKPLPIVLIFTGGFFIVTSLIIQFIFPELQNFANTSGYQLVLPRFGGHNHLGDFLAIIVTIMVFNASQKSNYKYIISIIVYTLFAYFSFSRSAILSMSVVSAVILSTVNIQRKFRLIIVILGVLIPLLAFLFITLQAKELYGNSLKSIIGDRNEYFTQATKAIMHHPLLGFGPGNFNIASIQFTDTDQSVVESSHNIFLDMLSEHGILAGVIFIVFVLTILVKGERKQYYFAFLAMILLFQTDYFHKFYSILALFFFMGGLSFSSKHTIKIPVRIPVLVLLILTLFIAASQLLASINKPELGLLLNPTNPTSQNVMLEKYLQSNNNQMLSYLTGLHYMTQKGNALELVHEARVYYALGNKKLALTRYYEAYELTPLKNTDTPQRIYELLIEMGRKNDADTFGHNYLRSVAQPFSLTSSLNSTTKLNMIKLCQTIYNNSCPYIF